MKKKFIIIIAVLLIVIATIVLIVIKLGTSSESPIASEKDIIDRISQTLEKTKNKKLQYSSLSGTIDQKLNGTLVYGSHETKVGNGEFSADNVPAGLISLQFIDEAGNVYELSPPTVQVFGKTKIDLKLGN